MGRILIVDDNATNRDLLRRRVEKLGHEVEEAENGQQCLEKMRANAYDLVFLDVMMPVMDGYGVLEEVKEDIELSQVSIIVISALSDLTNVVKAIELGADDYLQKPFNPTILEARLKACILKKQHIDLEREFAKKEEDLLKAILPPSILEEMISTGKVTPKLYKEISVLFCDVVNFSACCRSHTPEEIVASLQVLVEVFEDLAEKYGIQKIKTHGDALMGVGGLENDSELDILPTVRCALEFAALSPTIGAKWEIRAGIHMGPAMGGIIGSKHSLFDIWGETVNIASRVNGAGPIGGVCVTQPVKNLLAGEYETILIGRYALQGIGEMDIYRIISSGNGA